MVLGHFKTSEGNAQQKWFCGSHLENAFGKRRFLLSVGCFMRDNDFGSLPQVPEEIGLEPEAPKGAQGSSPTSSDHPTKRSTNVNLGDKVPTANAPTGFADGCVAGDVLPMIYTMMVQIQSQNALMEKQGAALSTILANMDLKDAPKATS